MTNYGKFKKLDRDGLAFWLFENCTSHGNCKDCVMWKLNGYECREDCEIQPPTCFVKCQEYLNLEGFDNV